MVDKYTICCDIPVDNCIGCEIALSMILQVNHQKKMKRFHICSIFLICLIAWKAACIAAFLIF